MSTVLAAPKGTRILVVDDEGQLLNLLSRVLQRDGYDVIAAQDGTLAVQAIEERSHELVIIDVNIPYVNGFELCRRVREDSETSIIIISGRASEEDKLRAFGLGADDYMTKPFGMAELLARIRAVLRRARARPSEVLDILRNGELEINFTSRLVRRHEHVWKLTPIEFDLLKALAFNAGRVLTHQMLLTQVWGPEYGDEREYLRVHISHLRRKIEPDPAYPKHIQTIPRVAYQFSANLAT